MLTIGLSEAEQAQANGNGTVVTSTLSPTRRKKRALALSLAQRLVEMSVDVKGRSLDSPATNNLLLNLPSQMVITRTTLSFAT